MGDNHWAIKLLTTGIKQRKGKSVFQKTRQITETTATVYCGCQQSKWVSTVSQEGDSVGTSWA